MGGSEGAGVVGVSEGARVVGASDGAGVVGVGAGVLPTRSMPMPVTVESGWPMPDTRQTWAPATVVSKISTVSVSGLPVEVPLAV